MSKYFEIYVCLECPSNLDASKFNTGEQEDLVISSLSTLFSISIFIRVNSQDLWF